MSVLRLSIDTKSLYYNIKNDNQTGHTATVATPLKQGSAIRPELSMLSNIPESISPSSRESLATQIHSNSRADAKINGIYVFDKVAVNGHRLRNLPACWIDGHKKFAIVQQTATREKSFIISTDIIQFINDFAEDTFLYLVTDICGSRKINAYSAIEVNALTKSIASIRFEDRK